jgi:hypothetical protein
LNAWCDDRDLDFGLYGQLLDPQPSPIGPELQLVSGGPIDSEMSLASSSDAVALAWSDLQRLHVSLVDLDGRSTAAASVSPSFGSSA